MATVWLRSRRASIPAIPTPANTDAEVRAWLADVVLPTREVWVADEDGTVLALLVLDEGCVDQLYVDPVRVGQGIGRELLALAKQRRPTGLELWTFQANAGARRFYERHGFVATDTTAGDNEERAPDIRYAWRPLDRQPVLESDLVRLRPLAPGDLDDLFAIASDPLLWEQHPAKERATPAGFARWFDDAMASGGALVAIDRVDGRVIGTSRFDHYDDARRAVEIGWTFLARSQWGGPYNGEMKRLMLQHAFAAVDTVLFRVHSGNIRSQRAVEKLGAARVATEPDPYGTGHVVVLGLHCGGAARPSPVWSRG